MSVKGQVTIYQEYTMVERSFHNATHSSVTNVHPSIWKLTPRSMKEEIIVKKKKCDAE